MDLSRNVQTKFKQVRIGTVSFHIWTQYVVCLFVTTRWMISCYEWWSMRCHRWHVLRYRFTEEATGTEVFIFLICSDVTCPKRCCVFVYFSLLDLRAMPELYCCVVRYTTHFGHTLLLISWLDLSLMSCKPIGVRPCSECFQ